MKKIIALLLALAWVRAQADELSAEFHMPPASARPWVYWFWNNGNVTKAGITADLEAMKRAGIGGVIIMDVVERFAPPPGPADFMSPVWQDLFQFAVAEAHRLGLEINMTNGPGWCGSSGPWITPALSMQMLVATNFEVAGPVHYSGVPPKPATFSRRQNDVFNSTVTYADYYQDIAVLAVPETPGGVVAPASVLDLTANLDANGRLDWEAPAGKWLIERIGHTTTGSSTRPPVKGGNGLECDKLSREAMDVHFTHMMGKLIATAGSMAGTTLSATHIDSWEVGSQNWTPKFREEFQQRRGYDPTPFLPDITGLGGASSPNNAGWVIGDPAIAERFRWDFRETIAELLAENYVGRLAELAHAHGLRLTLEGYDLPFGDEATYTTRADEPMSEFWATGGSQNQAKARQMASVAHIMGRSIVGAEAFTSGDNEQWKLHPATVKALGDYEFSQGINRFVIHRYAHQPYLDRFPGATMGPWGLHYERTQTWWEMSRAWHEYLARCQYLLRQGLFVADLCYLRPEQPDQTYFTPSPPVPDGCKYDECSAESLIQRMSVADGRLVLPDGMSYSVLVLPANGSLMTPGLLRKIQQLVAAGATVYGPRPIASPSLSGYPKCDEEVATIAAAVWGDCDDRTVMEHAYGKGRIIWGPPLTDVLAQMATTPDFSASGKLNWIHRRTGKTELYFVANETPVAVETKCEFRVHGLRPELWNPQTGETSPLAVYEETADGISVQLRLEGSGSTFVVFRPAPTSFDPVAELSHNGRPAWPSTRRPVIRIQKATYGVPGDAQRTREVANKVQALADRGEFNFNVGMLADGDDPAYGTVKTLVVDYTSDGAPARISGQDPDTVSLTPPVDAPGRAAEIRCSDAGQLSLAAAQPGEYEMTFASGKTRPVDIKDVPAPMEISGPWTVHFPPKWGAPEQITLDRLGSLSDSTIPGVKYFSGTATYTKTFDWNPTTENGSPTPETWLDLGNVQVMAEVTLNGHDLGIVWKAPFCVNLTPALKPGQNDLEIRVADLWPNRMIGDAALPEADRLTWSSYEPFTKDSPLPESGLLGPVTVRTVEVVPLP